MTYERETGRDACSAAVWNVEQGEELSVTAPASAVVCGLREAR